MGGLSIFWSGPVSEIPTDLSLAINHALRIVSWQENLMTEEMPPVWMWPLEWELDLWFEDVQRQRELRYNPDGADDREEPEMMHNELADRFRR